MTDDLLRAWTAWIDSLHTAGYPARSMPRPPAGPDAVAYAEATSGIRFPDELRALYAVCDGQFPSYPRGPGPHPPTVALFPNYDVLPVADALVQWRGWADLHRQNGGDTADFDEFVTVRGQDPVRAVYWDLGWWPLAMDGGGNFLAAAERSEGHPSAARAAIIVDTVPERGGTVGQVIVAGPDEDERRVLATGVADYLDRLTAAGPPPSEFPNPEDPDPDPDRMVHGWDIAALR